MEILIIISIIVAIIWYQINKCPHGIYKGYNRCPSCLNERERNRRREEERQKIKEEMIRQAEEKRQEDARKLKNEIERHKIIWLEESRKVEFLLHLEPKRFQEFIWILFRKLGWEVKETPFSQDGGSDGLLVNGSTSMVLQCKRYRKDVGEPTVRDLYGTYTHLKATGAILVTTGRISNPARKFAKDKNIEMYDGEKLLSLMAEANLTTSLIPDTFVLRHGKLLPLYKEKLQKLEGNKKKVEDEIEKENCPQCGIGKLQVRKGYRGLFMGCSSYPECDYTTNLIKPKKSSKGYYARPRNFELDGMKKFVR